jgi:hypothetical protein
MALRLSIPRNEFVHFAALRDLGAEGLAAAEKALSQLGACAQHAAFVETLAGAIGSDPALSVASALLRLAQVRRVHDVAPDEVMKAFTADLQRQSSATRWSETQLAQWAVVAPLVAQLLALEAVVVLEKAVELSYAFPLLFAGARVLTDVRPVFNEEGDKMRAAVVTNTLEIRFSDDGEPKVIQLAVDAKDLGQIVKVCERARAKTHAVREQLLGQVPTVIAGLDDGD